jgi:NAD(P)-dependent dehydrogenase (short-subunit alcohol dehydrogenase family)
VTGPLKDQTVLVIGRGGGLARAIALAAQDAGAQVVVAGRDQEKLSTAYAAEPGISTETVDLTDEASIAALGERLGSLDLWCPPPRRAPAAGSPTWTGTRSGCPSTPRSSAR